MVYHGPREQVVPFFDSLGFSLPERKGVADFLQEICSQNDQEVQHQQSCLPQLLQQRDAGCKGTVVKQLPADTAYELELQRCKCCNPQIASTNCELIFMLSRL